MLVEAISLPGVQQARSEIPVLEVDGVILMLQVGQAAQRRFLFPKVQALPLAQQAKVGDKPAQPLQVLLHAQEDVGPNEVTVLGGVG